MLNKKHIGYFLIFVLSVMIMILCMCVLTPILNNGSAFADGEKGSVTINSSQEGVSYDVYQVFLCNFSSNDEYEDVPISATWGSGFETNHQNIIEFLGQYSSSFTEVDSTTTSFDVLKTILKIRSEMTDTSDIGMFDSNFASAIIESGVTPGQVNAGELYENSTGYYLFVTHTDSSVNTPFSTKPLWVPLNGNKVIQEKVSIPTIESKVKGITDSGEEWLDFTEASPNENVELKCTSFAPDDIATYEVYPFSFNVKLNHLTYTQDSVKVTVSGSECTGYFEVKAEKDWEHTTLTISIGNLKDIVSSSSNEILLEYNASLDSDAVVAGEGNSVETYVTFPSKQVVNNRLLTINDNDQSVTDIDKIFTHELSIDYLNSEGSPLSGCNHGQIYLIQKNGEKKEIIPADMESSSATCSHEIATKYVGDDGQVSNMFTFSESHTPDNYNIHHDIEFKIDSYYDSSSGIPECLGIYFTPLTNDNEVGFSGDISDNYVPGHEDDPAYLLYNNCKISINHSAIGKLPTTGEIINAKLVLLGLVIIVTGFIGFNYNRLRKTKSIII